MNDRPLHHHLPSSARPGLRACLDCYPSTLAWLSCAAGLLLAAGCATQKPATRTVEFYPPPPNPPRLQYLTGFSSEKALRGGEEKNMMTFLTGAKVPEKEMGKPYGLAVWNKKIYVADTGLRAVLVIDLATQRIGALQAQGEGALKLPLNLTIDSDGTLYVADSGREQVVLFDKAGNYVDALGQNGEMKPRDVAVNKDRIYIADLQKHNVRVLDKATRKPLFEIPRSEDPTNRAHALFTPTNLALDSKGRVYVSDTGAFHVQVYDAEGKFVRSIGEMGDGQGQFARVKGVTVDRQDRLYAVDAMSQVVQIFDTEAKLLTWFGEPGADANFNNLPAKVVLDYDDVGAFQKYVASNFKVEHLVIVANQIGAHKISVYGFGQKK